MPSSEAAPALAGTAREPQLETAVTSVSYSAAAAAAAAASGIPLQVDSSELAAAAELQH